MGKTPVLTKQQETGLTTIVRKGVLLEQKQCSLQDQLGRIPSAAELQAGQHPPPFCAMCPCG